MKEENYSELREIVRMTKNANDQKYEAHSKSMLKKHIETKFKTTMIGALSKFEELFGHLWGHGLTEDQLTEEQLRFREAWQLARTEILNNGNNQLRAAQNEIEQYTIRFNKSEYNFLIKDNKGLTRDE